MISVITEEQVSDEPHSFSNLLEPTLIFSSSAYFCRNSSL